MINDVWRVFWHFLVLGCISFGGPAAHIGYFQQRFVQQYRWLEQEKFGQLVALSQFLPGPGSSQLGFAIGYNKAGLVGAVAAFIGFTLPSFTLMVLLSVFAADVAQSTLMNGFVYGLKLLAVVVVIDAVHSMFKSFCHTSSTVTVMLCSSVIMLVSPSLIAQFTVLIGGALIGTLLFSEQQSNVAKSPSFNIKWLVLFVALFVGLPMIASQSSWLSMFNDFYQAGSLVFGGGHVVLPLLQHSVADAMTQDQFLMGYAAAQAMPGPMFTMATFLGAELNPDEALLSALLATLAIFLPGFLLMLALQNGWQSLAQRPKFSGAVTGINAAVVGLLLAALFNPVFTSAVTTSLDMALVLIGLFVLRILKAPIIALVLSFCLVGMTLHLPI